MNCAEGAFPTTRYVPIPRLGLIKYLVPVARCPYTDQLRIADIQPHLDVAVKFGIIPRAFNAAELLIR